MPVAMGIVPPACKKHAFYISGFWILESRNYNNRHLESSYFYSLKAVETIKTITAMIIMEYNGCLWVAQTPDGRYAHCELEGLRMMLAAAGYHARTIYE